MKTIAIIPARGGSKRIPRKNIKNFFGFPIIKYSIDAAIKSACFDEIMVSTDDEQIAKIAKSYGARVPFLRSKTTSSSKAILSDVIVEVITEYKKLGQEYDFVCMVLSTAPFLTGQKLKKGFNLLKKTKADTLIPVVKFSFPIQRACKIKRDKLEMIEPKFKNKHSQEIVPTYHDAGQFYWLKTKKFLSHRELFSKNTATFELPESEVQDIDTEEDWKIAELKYRLLNDKKI